MAEETNTERELGIIQIESKKLTNIDNFLKGDTNIKIIGCPFPNVTSAVSAFENCSNLESFNGNLDSLQYGNRMFYACEKLETFTGDLPSLSNGNNMFYYTSISEFTTDLPSLTDGSGMFYDCDNLKTFVSNFENLSTYTEMFKDTHLETFKGGWMYKITDSGENFISTSCLSESKETLTTFQGNLRMSNTSNMFKDFAKLKTYEGSFTSATESVGMFHNCIALESFSDGIWATNAESMFRGCENLNYIDSYTNNL